MSAPTLTAAILALKANIGANCHDRTVARTILTMQLAATALLLIRMRRRRGRGRGRRRRQYWIRPMLRDRETDGEYHCLVQEMRLADHENFFAYFRMMPDRFDDLLSRVGTRLQKQFTTFRRPIEPGEQLAMTLRYLAHGDSQTMISLNYRVGKGTICQIIRRTCNIIWEVLGPTFLQVPNQVIWEEISDDFNTLWNFPNCVGAIDGKHVTIKAPANNSLVLLAACDAHYVFTMVDVGGSDRESDGGIFSQSAFGKRLKEGQLQLPKEKFLPGTNFRMPHVFVADESFPLQQNLMRPYAGKHLPLKMNVYNYRLSRARRIIENSFGILAAKWRIYRRTMLANVKTVESVILATLCLHNYLCKMDAAVTSPREMYIPPGFTDFEDGLGEVHDGAWRELVTNQDALQNMPTYRPHNYKTDAQEIRDNLASYMCSTLGEVPWQYNIVTKG